MNEPVVITGWSAISPYGLGRKAFVDGLGAGRPAVAAIDSAAWDTTDATAALVPGFEAREVLGKKGTRGMNRLSGLAVATVGQLKDELPLDGGTGIVLGTTTGSAQTMMETVRAALLAERPYHVDPSTTPYGVMNGAAGQCAIWYGYRGPNATLAAGRPTGLAALNYARRLLLTGRAGTVLAGAAEEYSRARSWLEFHARPQGAPRTVLGEGCVMFALARPGVPDMAPSAEVLALDFAVGAARDWAGALRSVVARALAKAGLSAADVDSGCASGDAGPAGEAEETVLGELPGRRLPALPELIGETHAVSAAFQIAAVLALAEHDPAAVGRIALITSTDRPSGAVAAAVLRTGSH